MRTILILIIILSCAFVEAGDSLVSSERVTLAQVMRNNKLHTLLVLADNGSAIDAIDLSLLFNTNADMLDIYHKIGFDKLVKLSLENNSIYQSYPLEDLLSPAGKNSHHIAVGLNYRKHADEVNTRQMPFLFVKTTKPTRQQAINVNSSELLDYEVELCVRPLTTMENMPIDEEPAFGFFLCGDFTDRAELLRNINTENLQSGRGFSKAKSKVGYFPTGPYMVISRHWQRFIAAIELSLTLNGKLKQRAMANLMIWPLRKILEKSWLYDENNQPLYTKKVSTWLPNNLISEKMVFLTGTPEGIIFKPPPISFKIIAAAKYIYTGAISNMSLKDYVLEQYIQSLLEQHTFLQPGDQLIISANYLGKLTIKISEIDNSTAQ